MDHSDVLERLCRVCGKCVTGKSVKTKYHCQEFLDELERVFKVSAGTDDPHMHPKHFCHSCKRIISKAGPYYKHRTVVFEGWCAHEDNSCTVCQHFARIQRGGRPSKTNRTPGRPPTISSRYCIQHIHQVAPPPFTSPDVSVRVCELHLSVPASEFNCPICLKVLRSPVQLVTCGNVVCAGCLCCQIQDALVCPCCNHDHLQDFASIRPAPPLVVKVIGSLCTVCEKCHNHIQLKDYRDHNCCTTSPQQVLPHSSIEEVLHQPLTAPLSAIEQKLQTKLAKRSIAGQSSSDEGILQMKTGGKVSNTELKKTTKNNHQ